MDRQTQAQGLNREESMQAYRRVAEVFNLKGQQRTALDFSPYYTPILNAAHKEDWTVAAMLLGVAGIVAPEDLKEF